MPVKYIISFGAVWGGFELAWAIRNEILIQLGVNVNTGGDSPVYIDALSLKEDKDTTYPWSEEHGIFKMQNPNWETFFKKAMSEAKCMIFIITKPWLKSKWCLQEFEWFNKSVHLAGIFIVYPEAETIISQSITTEVGLSKIQIDDLDQVINHSTHKKITVSECFVEHIPGFVEVKGKSYHYKYKYALGPREMTLLRQQLIMIK